MSVSGEDSLGVPSPDSEDDEGFTVFTKKKKGVKPKSQTTSIWLQRKLPLADEENKHLNERYS